MKTSDVRGAGTDANVFCILFGENGDSGELHLKDSESGKSPFENNQLDTFSFPNILSLGQLIKLRIWHDNKGLGAAWHCQHVEVEDLKGGQKYMFPCNRWLSKNDDDKQVCRELSCANLPSPSTKDKISKLFVAMFSFMSVTSICHCTAYEIEVTTSDKKDAGMIHHGWLILEGDKKSSKEFVLENSAKKKILRR